MQIKHLEFSIVIAAESNNPTILNPDFLKRYNIVPNNWDLSKEPISTLPIAQVIFKNGINIISQIDKIVFMQSLESNDLTGIKIPDIAKKYLKEVPLVKYTAIGINSKISVFETDNLDEINELVNNKFISNGPWLNIEDKKVETKLKFKYELNDKTLNLEIQVAEKKINGDKVIYLLLLGTNFHYNTKLLNVDQFSIKSDKIIDNWEKDVDFFIENIIRKFFPKEI